MDLLQPRGGYRLEGEHYFSESWYQREQQALFSNCWTFAGYLHELADPGDYLVVDAGNNPLLVTKDQDGQLHALHNVCRHRGMKMLNVCGNAKVLSCPYHMWRYALDGRLEHVPQHLEQFPDVKLEQWGLLRGRVEVWAGLVFVHPDPNAQSLQQWLGGLAERLKRFDTSDLQQQVRKVFSMQANWKFYIENHIDWLHLYFLHAKSLRDYEHDGGELLQHGPHWTSFERPKARREDSAHARNAGMAPLPGLTDQDGDVGAHFVFPNLALLTNRYSFATLLVQPLGAEVCEVEMRVQVMPGNEGGLFGSEDFEQVMFEDRHAAEQLQKAARSTAFGVGPMAMGWEAAIASFHASYRRHLDIS